VVCRAVSCLMPKRFRMSGLSEKGVTSPPVSGPTGSPASLMALAGDRAAPWPWRPKHSGSSAPEEVGFVPAEHWKHLRTTNPIESTFATVRHRTVRSKGCLSNKTALAMVFKLVESAQKTRRPHRRTQPVAKTDPGCEVRRRDRGHRHFCRASSRRLIFRPSPKFGDSSRSPMRFQSSNAMTR
jgi:hypothetical protein